MASRISCLEATDDPASVAICVICVTVPVPTCLLVVRHPRVSGFIDELVEAEKNFTWRNLRHDFRKPEVYDR